MATSEEKKELIEELKGPHYYRITVSGYGGEASYMRVSKEAHDFWKPICQEHGDSELIHYIINAEDQTASEVNSDTEYGEIDAKDIPDNAKFMHDVTDPESAGYNWYEPASEYEHVWGVASDNAYITIEKVDSDEYGAKFLDDVVDHKDLNEFINELDEEVDYEVEHTQGLENGLSTPEKGDYVCQMYSAEKGTFFESVITTPGLIDLQKLKFVIDESLNGEDILWSIEYDGEELSNDGGDTNGKGYYADIWQWQW
jgi:hypothetical protein